MKIKIVVSLTTLITILWLVPGVFANDFDHSKFDQILKSYVDEEGLVDYSGIAKDQQFSEYIQSLQGARVEKLSSNGQLAFWINAYNAVTIDKVIKKKPKKSVRENGFLGLWTSKKFFTTPEHIVANRRLSPDDIEHEILRKQFKDPRIHFAIICASRSCPPLPRVAYNEANVQTRLEEETKSYLNSARGTRIDLSTNTLYVSKLFDWFSDDFTEKNGSTISFIRPYLDEKALSFLDGNPKISYLKYDWTLNAQGPLER